jgi:hypothetical protein
MKTFLRWFIGIVLVLFFGYSVGPRPSKPDFTIHEINLPASLNELENNIAQAEKSITGIKPDNQARIIWADSSKKEKTRVAFLYLHGFSASQAEGDPVHRDLAKKYHANLYLSRLSQHGIDKGDSSMISLNAGEYEASEKMLLLLQKN